jgi:CrcB protein
MRFKIFLQMNKKEHLSTSKASFLIKNGFSLDPTSNSNHNYYAIFVSWRGFFQMIKVLFVGLGGFCGSILRYAATGLTHKIFPSVLFPLGTFAVNFTGCLLIGFILTIMQTRQAITPELRLFLLIGMLGSFTTFSTFGGETFTLASQGQILYALLNIMLHLLIALPAVWIGSAAANLITR